MNLDYARQLINKTKEDYNNIFASFSESRRELWPELKELEKYAEDSKTVLDVGCGNGRLLELFRDKKINYFGVDISEKLIEKAKEKYGNKFRVADILSLPFSDNYFDSVWSIAVLHHIPSRELRLKAVNEARRVLKEGGRLIMTCWNLYQPRYLKLLFKFLLRKVFWGSKLDIGDAFVPWKNTKIDRYYHAFTRNELKKLFESAGLKVEELRFLKRENKEVNILIIGKK